MLTLLFPLTLACYAAACVLYMAHLGSGNDVVARVGRWLLLGGFIAHTGDIGIQCVQGIHPLDNTREAISLIAYLAAGIYLGLALRYRIPTVGALLVPVVIVLAVAARAAPAREPGHAASLSFLFELHIALATAGVAVFAVAAGDAAVFLLSERQLKRHRMGRAVRVGPALETLDHINRICILVGFPLLTMAMILGALLAVRHPDGGPHLLLHPRYLFSVVAWGLYGALLVARAAAGWRGRRAAQVTLAGFGAALCVLVLYYLNSLPAQGQPSGAQSRPVDTRRQPMTAICGDAASQNGPEREPHRAPANTAVTG